MISSEKEYLDAMREMIRKVQSGYEPPFDADAQELEIFGDCIKNGYLIGKTTYIGHDGYEHELRTLDGKMHAELTNHVVPPKGLAFLSEGFENAAPNNDEENSNVFKKVYRILRPTARMAWALFAAFSTIVTVFGWPMILRFLSFLRSFF